MSAEYGFTREQRLRRRADFLRIQRDRSNRLVSRHFVWLLAPGRPDGVARLGITVTRRIGGAVVRNRAKRLIREVYRHMPGLLPDGVDLVVIVRRPLTGMRFQDALQEWKTVQTTLSRRARAMLRSSQKSRDLP